MSEGDLPSIVQPKGLEESPGFLLWRAGSHWKKAIEAVLKPLNLTHPQFVILASVGWLTRKGENASQAKVGRRVGLDANTTSQILRILQKKEFIERIRSSDEKSKYPLLTSSGKKALEDALPLVEKADRHFFEIIDSDLKNAAYLKALKKLSKLPESN